MKKDKFVVTTFILIVGSMITRILGFIIKIIYTRLLGESSVSLYMLIMPTYQLLITLASLGMPIAISKLVSEEKKRSKDIFFSIFPLCMIINTLLIALVISLSPFIADRLLNEPDTKYLIISCTFVIPFISISSLIRGYFFGKQRVLPHTLSNIIEQIVRFILIISILPKLIAINPYYGILGLILLSIISEISSIIIFIIFLPKKIAIKKSEIKPDIKIIKDVLSIGLPTLSSRLVGSIGYFLEPIVFTFILTKTGFSHEYIIHEYGIYNAYTLSLLMMPSFFITSISTSLLPEISKNYAKKNFTKVKRIIKQSLLYTFIIGIIINIVIFFKADSIMMLLYKTNSGINYYKILMPFFLIFYLEGPLISTLQAINKSFTTFKISLIGVIIKLSAIIIFGIMGLGIYSLIIAEIINIIIVVSTNFKEIKKVI